MSQKKKVIILISVALALSACSLAGPYHATLREALTGFPGYVNDQNLGSVSILQQEETGGGLVLLYRYSSYQPETSSYAPCLATTFVTQEETGGWRAQSASRLGCGQEIADTNTFSAAYTVGGNVTELTTVYGLSQRGHQVRIEWSDGKTTVVPLTDGTFLKPRPHVLQVQRVELLNAEGEVLESVRTAFNEVSTS